MPAPRPHIVVIDHRDSFVYNLVQGLGDLGASVSVLRSDRADLAMVREAKPDAIVLSPGPGDPQLDRWFRLGRQIVLGMSNELPILGVCLGHQGIAAALGGRVVPAPVLVHGQASEVRHDGGGVFTGLPSPLTVGRYHSLVVEATSLPPSLRGTAWTADGLLMGLRHVSAPLEGVQFHPESVLTPQGSPMLANFLHRVRRFREVANG